MPPHRKLADLTMFNLKRKIIGVGLTILLVLLGATQATHALASITGLTYNNAAAQSVSSSAAPWVVFPADTSTTLVAGGAFPVTGFTAPVPTVTCGFVTLNTGAANTPSGSSTITMASVAGLGEGMTAARKRIPANDTIASINLATPSITLVTATSGGSIAGGSAITFTFPCFQKFFSINNRGSLSASSFQIGQTVNSTNGNNIILQSCSGGTWNETTGVCSSGAVNMLTTTGTTPNGFVTPTLTVTSLGTQRIRALSTQSARTTTINIVLNSSSQGYTPTTSNL